MRRKFGFTLISRRGGVVVYTRQPQTPRPSVLDSLLGTQLDAPGHGLHGLYDGALHGARRLRDLREDRRARERACRDLHLLLIFVLVSLLLVRALRARAPPVLTSRPSSRRNYSCRRSRGRDASGHHQSLHHHHCYRRTHSSRGRSRTSACALWVQRGKAKTEGA